MVGGRRRSEIAARHGGRSSWQTWWLALQRYAFDQAIANTMIANTTASSVATAAHRRADRANATSLRNRSRQAAQRASLACCLVSTAPMRRSVSAPTSV